MKLLQEQLKAGKLQSLVDELHLQVTKHPDPRCPLVILNYDHILSPKNHEIADYCRSLVVDTSTNTIVNTPFRRFYNLGEFPNNDKNFAWGHDIQVQEKLDGSLIQAFGYKGKLCIITRSSFAQGLVNPRLSDSLTWEDLILQISPGLTIFDGGWYQRYTLLLELCTIYNHNVVRYPTPGLYLLAMCDNNNRKELKIDDINCKFITNLCRFKNPTLYTFSSLPDLLVNLEEKRKLHGDQFEGFVVRDRNNMRLKIKNPDYVYSHKFKNNGNVFVPKNLVPIILEGKHDDLVAKYPEYKDVVDKLVDRITLLYNEMVMVWDQAVKHGNQKDFALSVIGKSRTVPILFEARKRNALPWDIYKEYPETWIKIC